MEEYMMNLRELWLLRHAQAVAGGTLDGDAERPLSEQGIQDAARLGAWMKQQGWLPDYMVSSSARRTRQTANQICNQLGINPDTVHYDVQLYLASRRILLELIGATGMSCHKLLLIGHNPGFEELLLYLCPELMSVPAESRTMGTANLARVQLESGWSGLQQGSGKLLDITRPRQLDVQK
jgi:phosphohistidine phosphatase